MRPRGRLVLFSAALVAVLAAVLAVLLPAGIASAAGRPAAETRVWAISSAAQDHIRAGGLVLAGQRLGEPPACPFWVPGACVAPEELPVAEQGPHLALGLSTIRSGGLIKPDALAQFAAERGAITYQNSAFADIWSRPTADSVSQMIDRVATANGRISFNMEGIQFVDRILAGEDDGWTAQELRYVCGNAGARAITSFFNGTAPC